MGIKGGKGKDVTLYLNKGNGGIVNSSRGGIILAYKDKIMGRIDLAIMQDKRYFP